MGLDQLSTSIIVDYQYQLIIDGNRSMSIIDCYQLQYQSITYQWPFQSNIDRVLIKLPIFYLFYLSKNYWVAVRKLVYSPTCFLRLKNSQKCTMNLCIRKTNPWLLCFNETAGKLAEIRQGVKYFMRDVMFGTNSLAKYWYS